MLPEPDARKSTVRWLRGLAMTSSRSKLRPSAKQSGSSKTITRAASGDVFTAAGPPLQRILAVGRRQQIKDRFGAIALIRPHRLFYILVPEDVALAVARIVSNEADGGPDVALAGGDADLFHGGIINAHAHHRRAQHFRYRVRTLKGELGVEILARSGMALERCH